MDLILKLALNLLSGYMRVKGIQRDKRTNLIDFINQSVNQVADSAKLRKSDINLDAELDIVLAERRKARLTDANRP